MILVTGGTGFIGSHLVERLVAQGRALRCLVRRSTTNLPAAIELAHGDLESGAGLTEALRGVDTVIHLAGITKARTAADYHRGNALATATLLRAACRLGNVGRLVHVSSLAAAGPSTADRPLTEADEPRPVSHYGRSKLAAEEAVRHSPLRDRTVIVRPPVVYGPRDRDVYQPIRTVARGWMAQIGTAQRRFSHIYVGDLVDGLIAAADHTNATAGAAVWVLGGGGWPPLGERRAILSRDKVLEACCAGWVCDPGRARRELGFCASTGLEEGLRHTLDWYKEAGWLKF